MLIVGLGNPGDKYANTKHNMGFCVINQLAQKHDYSFKLGKGEYMFSKHNDITLLKPLTYMNNSGIAIKDYMNYFDISSDDLLVVYDDADLDLGQIRFKPKGSSGGQKGIESIIYHLKTDNFLRLKVGIATTDNMRPLESYVLAPFKLKYSDLADEAIENCCDAIDYLLNNNINDTMNKYNKKNKEKN
jgi:PTH1 family peptidyl-tRNA hydrolase